MEKQQKPAWYGDVKKALAEQGITVQELADDLGCHRVYLSGIINGKNTSKTMEQKILERLGISA